MNKNIQNWFDRIFPVPKPVSREEKRRAKTMLLGAGAGCASGAEDGVMKVEIKEGDNVVKTDRDAPPRQRAKWLELAKKLTTACLSRQSKLNDLLPDYNITANEKKETLKAICALNRDIGKLADEMASLEAGNFGVVVIIEKPTLLMRITVTLMTIARLIPHVNHELGQVEDVVRLVVGSDPEDALAVRNLFRSDSPLRSHFHMAYVATLDESDVRLKESSLNRILANKPGDGSEDWTEAVALKTKWR